MLHLLLGEDWTSNRNVILRKIADDVQNCRENRILIVPELISHETERRLCQAAGDHASRFAEVVSFTRLVNRVTSAQGSASMQCLDSGGRVVAMASAARHLSSRLKAYASVETRPEFLTGLVDAVDEFKRCCITPSDLTGASLQSQGALAQKLEELALLMEGYDVLCSRGKRDPRDQMTFLLELLEDCSFAQEHVFYIDGFPDFTRQNMAIIEHFIRYAPNVTVSLNCDQPGSNILAFEKAGETAQQLIRCANRHGIAVNIEYCKPELMALTPVRKNIFQGEIVKGECQNILHVYRAESAYQAAVHAAQSVLQLIHEGCRYRDITVVCSDMGLYQPMMSQVFHRYHIPLYQAGTEDILKKSIVSTVLGALDAAISGFEQREVLRYLRSPMSPLTPDECDRIENYAVVWGIRGKKWTADWQWHPEGLSGIWDQRTETLLENINEYRSLAITPLVKLHDQFRAAGNVREQVLAIYQFLEDISLAQRLSEQADQLDADGDNCGAQILNQLWDIMLRALEQLYDVLGETKWEAEHFVRLLRLLLSQYDVGTIPPVLDAVQMGPVSAMRCNEEKHLIILGADEGKFPGYAGSSGILTDQDRVALRQMGVPLTGGAMEGIQAEFSEIYGVICGALQSIRVYSAAEQPSFIFRRLSDLAGTVEEANWETGFAYADAFEAGAYLASINAEQEASALDVLESYREVSHRKRYDIGKLNSKTVKKLYGDTLNLSASQIDMAAKCRMSYFLQYGLRIKERKEAEIDPSEFGTYVHAVLENTARCIRDLGGFHVVSLEDTLSIAHRYSEEYAAEHFSQLDSDRIAYLFRRNMQELDMVVQDLWLELKESLFEPQGFEVEFGADGSLPPIAIPNSSMNAMLRGYVDRVDTWKTQGSTYFRVVDYKTGSKDFDYCDVFNGIGLQMLLYMFALRDSQSNMFSSHPVAAGVQYFPAKAPYISVDGKMDEAEAEKERLSHWKRKGLLLEDKAVLQAMEPGDHPKRMSYTIKSDGSYCGDLADRDQMKMLETYIFKILSGLVDDIASGNVEPNPYTRGSSHSACDYCPFESVCHKQEVSGRRNYKTMTAQRFWEEIAKEV